MDGRGLSELGHRVLAFEREMEAAGGSRDAAIRSEFGVSPVRYYQMLYAVIDSPPALRHDPLLVRRLQRVRDARRATRGRLGPARAGSALEPQD